MNDFDYINQLAFAFGFLTMAAVILGRYMRGGK